MENAVVFSFKSRLKSAQVALDGFPWKLAAILYTLSWGWSLLRPNTLYWDDWQFSPKELWSSGRTVGLAPWMRMFDMALLQLGNWPIRLFTFLFFLGTAFFLYQVLRIDIEFICPTSKNLITLLFLVIPANHARISIVIFGYTTSYFLFFLGWFVLIRYRSTKSFSLACMILFLSFMTHSFLFFLALPLMHFGWIHRSRLRDLKNFNSFHVRITSVALLPAFYILARFLFWSATDNSSYQRVYSDGVLMSGSLFAPFICCLLITYFWFQLSRRVPNELTIILVGTFALAISLFPYLITNNIDRNIFSFNIGWQSRHLMLTPLGISFVVVGISQLVSKKKHYIAKLALTLSVIVNIFVGSQYYLQSAQQTEIINLFKAQKISGVISEFSDETARFKGRGAKYSEYEFFGMLNEAGYSYPKRVNYKYVCKANPDGAKLTVKSDKSFLDALLSRNTSTFFEITTCAEVLSQQG